MPAEIPRKSPWAAAREAADNQLMNEHEFQQILSAIASRADQLDESGNWPKEDLEDLTKTGAMRWAVPRAFGGEQLSPIEIHQRYEQIAAASLATALILTQRDSAIQIIAASENSALRDELIPKFASGEWFTTVGIAQLTT